MQRTRLRTTQLRSTGLEITPVGFGAWAIASLELRDEDVAEIEGGS